MAIDGDRATYFTHFTAYEHVDILLSTQRVNGLYGRYYAGMVPVSQ